MVCHVWFQGATDKVNILGGLFHIYRSGRSIMKLFFSERDHLQSSLAGVKFWVSHRMFYGMSEGVFGY
jgi:hypothetical protein